jgi:hypothetical protein
LGARITSSLRGRNQAPETLKVTTVPYFDAAELYQAPRGLLLCHKGKECLEVEASHSNNPFWSNVLKGNSKYSFKPGMSHRGACSQITFGCPSWRIDRVPDFSVCVADVY